MMSSQEFHDLLDGFEESFRELKEVACILSDHGSDIYYKLSARIRTLDSKITKMQEKIELIKKNLIEMKKPLSSVTSDVNWGSSISLSNVESLIKSLDSAIVLVNRIETIAASENEDIEPVESKIYTHW